ncbi:cell division regulator GpsB [Shouchella clausii]|jgi:DivIVA domain-containing protein|uniref:Cell cycle protein GpsB n=1 Tax=Shouchella clausii TaxID=79880 RepID=A0A268S003_SHOCL|nr:cell division regulator GpsB [Shouchella clausii]PAD41871.1 cell division protein DivIVA [Bacillus sp. 7520-S]SPU21367.1 cell division protein GpsB [Niallia circulans]AST97756.1 cell division protein DivIVA [Shouchella clausii]MBU8595100.1 cell division regulator GpsB [Shouchella clausii]MCM3549471.1 cell division regulator GpsB [Shouchella clausii]
MSQMEIKLTAKEILDKDFKQSMRGYNQDEVDKFLDTVIQDYEAFQKKIEQLERENELLKQDLKKQTERPQRSQTVTAPSAGSTNYDILQRLSNLEKKVFGSKMYE